MYKSFILLFILFILGCSESSFIKPHVMYRADFSGEHIKQIEEFIDTIADKNKFRVFRKGRENMAVLTKGKKAFFSALYYKDDPIIIISNAGAGTILSISATDYGILPIEQLDGILKQLTDFLTNESLVKNLHIHVDQQKYNKSLKQDK